MLKDKISERKEGEETYRTIFENLPFAAFTLDREGKVLEANKNAEQLFGLRIEDVKGKKFSELGMLGKKDLLKAFMEFRKNLSGKVTEKTVYNVKLKDGREILLELVGIPLKEGGKVIKVLDIGSDITEQKGAERDLKENEERYRIQFEEALDAIFIADAETGIIVDCNRAATELVERSKSELIGQHQRILHPPEEIKGEFSETFKKHLGEAEGQVLETRVITKSGKVKDVTIKANLIELRDKKILQGIFRDITERKKAEEAIKKRAEDLEAFNELSVGRELKMVELKKRVRELEDLLKKHGIREEEKVKNDREENKANI